MNAPQQIQSHEEITQQMTATLEAQREDFLKEGAVSAEARIDRVEMQNVATRMLVQSSNRATVDGVAVAEQPFDTDILY